MNRNEACVFSCAILILFSFPKKRRRERKGKEADFILFSPQFPLPPSLKGKKRKRKGEFEECNCAFFFSRPFKKQKIKRRRFLYIFPLFSSSEEREKENEKEEGEKKKGKWRTVFLNGRFGGIRQQSKESELHRFFLALLSFSFRIKEERGWEERMCVSVKISLPQSKRERVR